MAPWKVLAVIALTLFVVGGIMWFVVDVPLGQFEWLGFTGVGTLLILLIGPDLLPRSLRRALRNWMRP